METYRGEDPDSHEALELFCLCLTLFLGAHIHSSHIFARLILIFPSSTLRFYYNSRYPQLPDKLRPKSANYMSVLFRLPKERMIVIGPSRCWKWESPSLYSNGYGGDDVYWRGNGEGSCYDDGTSLNIIS
jgi:hypothetical protein